MPAKCRQIESLRVCAARRIPHLFAAARGELNKTPYHEFKTNYAAHAGQNRQQLMAQLRGSLHNGGATNSERLFLPSLGKKVVQSERVRNVLNNGESARTHHRNYTRLRHHHNQTMHEQ